MPRIFCLNCNKEYWRHQVPEKSFCCHLCKKEYTRNNPVYNCVCFICRKPIYKIPSRITDHPLCSISCRNKYFSGERTFCKKRRPPNYTRIREKERRLKWKLKAINLLGGRCCKCKAVVHHSAFDFHHKDPSKKDRSIKNLISGSWKRIEKELLKCVLICSNCHREHHWRENNGC